MNWRFDFRSWHFHIGLSHSAKAEGVNSKLPDGLHFLMWDFDDKGEDDVKKSLLSIQSRFSLAPIYLVNTGLPRSWHAYCFDAHTWGRTLHILADTEGLDSVFFKIGVVRGFFTLRYSAKKGREFKPAIVLPSEYPEDVNPWELTNFIKYRTKRL